MDVGRRGGRGGEETFDDADDDELMNSGFRTPPNRILPALAPLVGRSLSNSSSPARRKTNYDGHEEDELSSAFSMLKATPTSSASTSAAIDVDTGAQEAARRRQHSRGGSGVRASREGGREADAGGGGSSSHSSGGVGGSNAAYSKTSTGESALEDADERRRLAVLQQQRARFVQELVFSTLLPDAEY